MATFPTGEQRTVERARVILLAHEGRSTHEIAETLHNPPVTRIEVGGSDSPSMFWPRTARLIPLRPPQAIG